MTTSGPRLSTHLLPPLRPVPNHLTPSAVVIEEGHILLVHHRRIGAWLPPGGHIDEGELPHEAAIREVFEETGVRVMVLSSELPISIDSDAFFFSSRCAYTACLPSKRELSFITLTLLTFARSIEVNPATCRF